MNIINIGILYVLSNIFLIVIDGSSIFAFIVHLSLFIMFASLAIRYLLKFMNKEVFKYFSKIRQFLMKRLESFRISSPANVYNNVSKR